MLNFAGSPAEASIPHQSWIDGAQKLTVAAWFSMGSGTSAFTSVLMQHDSNNGFAVFRNNLTNELAAFVRNSTTFAPVVATGLTYDAITHLALVFDGSLGTATDRFKFYINGSQTYTGNPGVTTVGTNTAVLGLPRPGWVGSVAEVGMWDRALSANEVASLAKGFSPLRFPRPRVHVPHIRNAQELIAAQTVTTVSATVAAHPRIYR